VLIVFIFKSTIFYKVIFKKQCISHYKIEMLNLFVLMVGITALSETNIIKEDDGTSNSGIFPAGSALVPRQFQSSMKFEFDNGISKITFTTRNKETLAIGTKQWYDPNTINNPTPPYFKLDQKGLFYLGGVSNQELLVSNNTEYNTIENGPFFVQLEYDFRIRIRMQSDPDVVVWEHPVPRGPQRLLDSYSKNWIAGGECLSSRNAKYSLCINENSQLVSNTGLSYSSQSIIEKDPRVFVIHNNGSFGYYDYKGKVIPLKNMNFKGDDESIDYITLISNEGLLTITDRANPDKIFWTLDISNTLIKEGQSCSSSDKCENNLICCLNDVQNSNICRQSNTCPKPFIKEGQSCSSSDKCETNLTCCLNDIQNSNICRQSNTCPKPFIKEGQSCSSNDKCEGNLICCLNDAQNGSICRQSNTCSKIPADLSYQKIYNYQSNTCVFADDNLYINHGPCKDEDRYYWAKDSDSKFRSKLKPSHCAKPDESHKLKLDLCENSQSIGVDINASAMYQHPYCWEAEANSIKGGYCSAKNVNQAFGLNQLMIVPNGLVFKPIRLAASPKFLSVDWSASTISNDATNKFAFDNGLLRFNDKSSFCLSPSSSGDIVIKSCETAAKWTLENKFWKSNNLCMDLNNGIGPKIAMLQCADNGNQKWYHANYKQPTDRIYKDNEEINALYEGNCLTGGNRKLCLYSDGHIRYSDSPTLQWGDPKCASKDHPLSFSYDGTKSTIRDRHGIECWRYEQSGYSAAGLSDTGAFIWF